MSIDLTQATFISHFPEFSDQDKYPSGVFDFYLTLADTLFNKDRLSTLLVPVTELFIAHNMLLEARAMAESGTGGLPGQQIGPVTSKSVGGVSVSYDVRAGLEINAGHWALTRYGNQCLRYIRLCGMGPLQVNGPFTGTGAWPGPYTSNLVPFT